ncbi:MAG: hypothetical protein ACHQD9_00160 [Chitinophagales bacterium]
MNTALSDSRAASVIHWIARILCVAAICFISIFSLDAFSPDHTLLQQLADFTMHMIPSFILLALLIVAWKWELIGGILIALIGFGTSPMIYIHNYNMNHSVGISLGIIAMINLPFIIVGLLFIISYYLIHRKHTVV